VEPAPKDVAVERLAKCRRLERAYERIIAPDALLVALVEPGREVRQRPGVPPKGHPSRAVELGVLGADKKMRAGDSDSHVAKC
jgi:hypothetical protein